MWPQIFYYCSCVTDPTERHTKLKAKAEIEKKN